MEPLPTLVLVRGHQELVGRLRLGDLAATVGGGRRFRLGRLPSAGLHGPLARSEGNAVFAEDPLDLPSLPIERLLDPSEERPLRLAHSDGEAEGEGCSGAHVQIGQWRERERHLLLLGEIPGQRSPDDRQVDVSFGDRVDDSGGPVLLVVEGREAGQTDHSAGPQRPCRRRVVVLVADHVDGDLQLTKARIVERCDVEVSIDAGDELI